MENGFTEEQNNFIFSKTKKSIILSATAGSGKTHCSIHRMKELINRGVNPSKIIFFSFTNAAVDELKKRVGNSEIRITTIHSFCFWLLDKMGKKKEIADFNTFIDWYEKYNKPNENASEKEKIEFEKFISNLQDDANFLESSISTYKLQKADGVEIKIPEYFDDYCEFLEITGKRDFSDILIDVRDYFKENKWLKMFKDKYDYLFVDEYQDTSSIQMEILLKLNAKYYYLVGDSNQSLYNYAGSSCEKIENLLKKRRNVEVMTLSMNFRSGINIVENSNKYSTINAIPFHQYEGKIYEEFIDYYKLIDLIKSEEEVVVLCRTNNIAKLIELNLIKRKIPINYLNYLKQKDLNDIKNNNISKLLQKKIDFVLNEFDNNVENLIKFIEGNRDKKSFVTTIHKSKGKEFDTCVIINSLSEDLLNKNEIDLPEDKKEFYSFFPDMENYEEEKNVHYVAVSRAKKNIYYMLIQK
jgi:DNA helicase-2/ATP-dependent DNA helicase PcrA